MKTTKLLGVVERQAGARVTRLLKAARKGYDRLTRSATKVTNTAQQRRYIRAVRQTIASAEKIIAQLKRRVDTVETLLGRGNRRRRRPVRRGAATRARRPARTVKRTAKRTASRTRRRARG
ncbi:MAG: hypothetical protein HYX37_01755 [Rhizobiales bacterium]|nr:hypothetical protein [Hyphomicrobiales bacterium]